MPNENDLPAKLEINFYDPAELKDAIDAYRTWSDAELRRYGLDFQSVIDIMCKVGEIARLPLPGRLLAIQLEGQFLHDAQNWFEINRHPNYFPLVPIALEVLGDINFLEAEGYGFWASAQMPEEETGPQPFELKVIQLFRQAMKCYGTGEASLLRQLQAAERPSAMTLEQKMQWVGFSAAHSQLVWKVVRAQIRVCAHRVIQQVTQPLAPIMRATAAHRTVLSWQARLPRRGFDEEEEKMVHRCLELASAALRVRFAHFNPLAEALLITATLAAMAGYRERPRQYCRAVIALNEDGKAQRGGKEARALLEILEET